MDSKWGYISKTLTMCKRDICKYWRISNGALRWIGYILEWLFLIMLKYKTKSWHCYENQQANKCSLPLSLNNQNFQIRVAFSFHSSLLCWVSGLTFCQPNNATSMEFITYEKGRMRTGKQVPLIHDNSAVCGPDTQSDCTNGTWPWNRGTPGWWFSDPAGRAMFWVISGFFEMTAGTSICFDVGFTVVCHSLWKVHDKKA